MQSGCKVRSVKLGRICCLTLGLILAAGSIQIARPAVRQRTEGRNLARTTASVGTIVNLTGRNASLTVRVYDYAGVNPASLAQSEKVAAEIFQNLGIDLTWVDCPLSKAQFLTYPACQSRMGTTDLVLRILPHRMAAKVPTRGEPLGFAQPCSASEPACELTVFYYRVDELATDGYRADRVLGHVVAHEMAHVLIGAGHSQVGIMRGEWSRDDLQRISRGLLLDFTGEESTKLRNAVLLRRSAPH